MIEVLNRDRGFVGGFVGVFEVFDGEWGFVGVVCFGGGLGVGGPPARCGWFGGSVGVFEVFDGEWGLRRCRLFGGGLGVGGPPAGCDWFGGSSVVDSSEGVSSSW